MQGESFGERLPENPTEKDKLNTIRTNIKDNTLLTFFQNSSDEDQERYLKDSDGYKFVNDHIQRVESVYIHELNSKIADGINQLQRIGEWPNINQIMKHCFEALENAAKKDNRDLTEIMVKRAQLIGELDKASNDELQEALDYIKERRREKE